MRERVSRVRDEVSLIDDMGRKLFTIDRWIWEEAMRRGDLQRWLHWETT